jgi:probable rRNA maturation factor
LGFDLDSLELSVRLVGDRSMRQLNRQWRGRDRTTDVLSFPQWPADARGILRPQTLGGAPLLLGDLVISLPVAAAQAAELGHSLSAELTHLLIHGILHLMGHDHAAGGPPARRMRAAEQAALRRLGMETDGLLARQNKVC